MKVKEIHVLGSRRLHLTVQCPSWRPLRTGESPHLSRTVLQLFPDLTLDKCENDFGLSFEEECQDTEIPHLFEHLVMEMQGQVLAPRRQLTGVTYWDWTIDPRGCFHVEVDFEHELIAIAAVRIAEKLINAIDQRRLEMVDLEDEMERLQALADLVRPDHQKRSPTPVRGRSGKTTRETPPPPSFARALAIDDELEHLGS